MRALERSDALVDNQSISEVLIALCTHFVVAHTAHESQTQRRHWLLTLCEKASASCTPDALQRRVHLEHLGDGDDALGSVGAFAEHVQSAELVVVQAAEKRKSERCQRLLTLGEINHKKAIAFGARTRAK